MTTEIEELTRRLVELEEHKERWRHQADVNAADRDSLKKELRKVKFELRELKKGEKPHKTDLTVPSSYPGWSVRLKQVKAGVRFYIFEDEMHKASVVVKDPAGLFQISQWLAAYTTLEGTPMGVPSVEELAKVGALSFGDVYEGSVIIGKWIAAATAIRDAVLRGVAPTDDQVEALARVLIQAVDGMSDLAGCSAEQQDRWRNVARAAFKHFGTVDPDAWGQNTGEIANASGFGVQVAPTDEQVEALARVLHKAQDWFYCRYGDHATKFDDYAQLRRAQARAAFKHFGTVPAWTGPTQAEAEAKWKEVDLTPSYRGEKWRAFYDWLLPQLPETAVTFECKECAIASQSVADLQLELDHVKTNLAECEHRIDAARAALEGE